MPPNPVLAVPVRFVNPRDLDARLRKVDERIRRRAYELYCQHAGQATERADWAQAERELNAAPVAGIADEPNEIRLTACVPGVNPSDVTVDVLPDEIVVEAGRNGEIERYHRFHLPARVDATRVAAHMHGSELDVIAPKAGHGSGD